MYERKISAAVKNNIEKTCWNLWSKEQVYSYNQEGAGERFVIDTPPPTVSGELHIGHLFSYTQTDILARFQRMQGKNVFYPMGWDNNGLPTEKRVQALHNVVCDPKAAGAGIGLRACVSRDKFIALCEKQTKEDQTRYEHLWRRLALSVDWTQTYETISHFSRAAAQRSFLDLYKKGLIVSRRSPVFWDTQFQTAVAQADMEDRLVKGFYYDIKFKVQGSQKEEFVISTTRPELLPACVAIAAHPNDTRYQKLFGKHAITPLFSAPVPVVPSLHADPEKGTGILMICTFGDKEDVSFWEKQNPKLPLKQIVGKDGRLMDVCFIENNSPPTAQHFLSLQPEKAQQFYANLKGLYVKQARKKISALLQSAGALVGEPRAVEHSVKFYEKGEHALELISARQWYVKVLEHKTALLKQGRKVKWHPPAMLKRYEQWVEGLNQDWCISRQRFFGVPFPVWYLLDEHKNPLYEQPILPSLEKGPVDPFVMAPAEAAAAGPGVSQDIIKTLTLNKRGAAHGFTADTAVMDTWAVSSLTPQINSHWGRDVKRHQSLFPADLRPQAHEIIRTWAFYTIAKAYFHEGKIPWRHIAVSGWVMNPNRVKMSKSKGRIQGPEELMDQYGVDAVRYWAGKSRLGQDTVFSEDMVKNGRRLGVKLLNAFRFMMLQAGGRPWEGVCLEKLTQPVDKAWAGALNKTVTAAKGCLEEFHYAPALEEIEKTFWSFCDYYLELVKARAYQLKDKPEGRSAVQCVDMSLYVFIKCLAPFMPYITEDLWGQRYQLESRTVHKAGFSGVGLKDESQNPALLQFVFKILEQVRVKKAFYKKSVSAPLGELKLALQPGHSVLWEQSREDIARAAAVDLKNIHVLSGRPEALVESSAEALALAEVSASEALASAEASEPKVLSLKFS